MIAKRVILRSVRRPSKYKHPPPIHRRFSAKLLVEFIDGTQAREFMAPLPTMTNYVIKEDGSSWKLISLPGAKIGLNLARDDTDSLSSWCNIVRILQAIHFTISAVSHFASRYGTMKWKHFHRALKICGVWILWQRSDK